MRQDTFGALSPVSTLTLGGGGLGMLWGPTTIDECIATVHAAVEAGITLLDLAPRYGDGKAEQVVGEAFGGNLPAGVRVTSKCNLGNPPAGEIEAILRRSIEGSLQRLRLSRLDLFFLHSNVVPDARFAAEWGDAGSRMTPYPVFVAHVRPVFETPGGRGIDRRLGPDRHRPSRHHHPAAERAARTRRGAVHRQPAGLAGRAEVLPRPGETARDHGGGARQWGRRDGHPRGAGRRAHRGDRPTAAGRPRRGPRLCACRRVPPALRRTWREPGGDRAPLRAVARHRHAGAGREEPRGTGGVRGRRRSWTTADGTDQPHRCVRTTLQLRRPVATGRRGSYPARHHPEQRERAR